MVSKKASKRKTVWRSLPIVAAAAATEEVAATAAAAEIGVTTGTGSGGADVKTPKSGGLLGAGDNLVAVGGGVTTGVDRRRNLAGSSSAVTTLSNQHQCHQGQRSTTHYEGE